MSDGYYKACGYKPDGIRRIDHSTHANQHDALPSASGMDISDKAVQEVLALVEQTWGDPSRFDAIATIRARIEADAKELERMKEQVRFHAAAYREKRAEADKWRKVANDVAYAWWEQDEDSATDYLIERGWDTSCDGPLSFRSLVVDVQESPHAIEQEEAE